MKQPIHGALAISLALGAIGAAPDALSRVVRFEVEQERVFADGTSFGGVGHTSGSTARPTWKSIRAIRSTRSSSISTKRRATRAAWSSSARRFSSSSRSTWSAATARSATASTTAATSRHCRALQLRARRCRCQQHPLTAADAGDGFLMRLATRSSTPAGRATSQRATTGCFRNFRSRRNRDGSPIVAPVRIEYSDRTIPVAGTFTLTLEGSATFGSYEPPIPTPPTRR